MDFPGLDEAVWNDSFRLMEVQAELEYFGSILEARLQLSEAREAGFPEA